MMRLDKFLSHNLALSRSQAKAAIRQQSVRCDGEVITDPGFKVTESCQVFLDQQPVTAIGARYLMLNKPVDSVCSNVDDGYPSVLRLLELPRREQLIIAGRLDADTTGLVLITDDGQWAHAVTSPQRACRKRYRVQLAEPVDSSVIDEFAHGVQLRSESGLTRPAQLDLLSPHEALLTIEEGKYHQVKRMFAAVGNKVIGLHREQIGGIMLDITLAPGEWRVLTAEEIDSVHNSNS